MLNSYNYFLLEKLLIESTVVYSNRFKSILKDVNSDIAKHLLDIEDKDKQVDQNYLDITTKDDLISFIQDAKAKRILGEEQSDIKYEVTTITSTCGYLKTTSDKNQKMFEKLGMVYPRPNNWNPSEGDVGVIKSKVISTTTGKTWCYFVVEEGEKECAINFNALRPIDERINKLWNTSRNEMNVGRIARSLCTKTGFVINDKDLQDFVLKYKSAYAIFHDEFRNFEMVNGEKIRYWYREDNYNSSDGTLGESCMRHDECQDYLDIYCNNTNVCSLLILKSDGDLLKGRCIVWKKDNDYYLDRIYTNDDSDEQLFIDYAIHKGYYYKSAAKGSKWVKNGEVVETLVIKLDSFRNISYFPYVDTLTWFDNKRGILSNRKTGADVEMYLSDTEGGFTIECSKCGNDSLYEGGCDTCYSYML